MPITRTPLDDVEAVRSKIGAFCDAMTPSEERSRLGARINELHDELADALRILRKDAVPRPITSIEEMETLPVGSLIRCVRSRSPYNGDVFEKAGGPGSRAPWLHLDPGDRQDGEVTVMSGHVERYYGDLSITLIHEGDRA